MLVLYNRTVRVNSTGGGAQFVAEHFVPVFDFLYEPMIIPLSKCELNWIVNIMNWPSAYKRL